ncbi:proton-coupled amino acid transporter-like protein pathetic [Aethina tumida]|uniref:proton-coupled amino acid transporter-like protein pathetic n=1 Tax=Aethina tumida TaxID=116153 RepID=UPI00096B0EF5|nr:proton-coupled amino acid transporter-like protein pathetic [Aethina tumida]XP_019868439.1 proton-coupled amino acid transporter-like protein pathetic [Aethina tumida]
MTEKQKEKYPSVFTIDNFSSTATLATNEIKVPIGSQDTLNEKVYDPFEHRHVEHPNTFGGALVHLIKSSLGTGILAIPRAFKSAGLVIGFIGTILIGLLCTYTIHLLVAASQEMCRRTKKPSLGFAETAEAVVKHGPKKIQGWSKSARNFVEIALLLTYYVGNAVYIVFIATSIKQLIDYLEPSISDWSDRLYMLIIMVPLVLCCQVRQLKHLVPFSFIANTAMVVAFAITLYYTFKEVKDVDLDKVDKFKDISGIPSFFSTVIFAMEGIGTVMPVENSMVKDKFIGCPGVLNSAMTVVVALYSIIGLFGYMAYGEATEATITKNLPIDEIPAQVAKLCISVAVFFTFMLQFYVPMDITWRKISHKIREERQNIGQIVLRTLAVFCITGIAIAAGEHLGPLIDLVGAIFFSTLGLLVPAVIDTIVHWEGDKGFGYWKVWKNVFIGILAIFGLVTGSYYAILAMTEE